MSAFVVLWGEGTLTMGLLWGLSLVRLWAQRPQLRCLLHFGPSAFGITQTLSGHTYSVATEKCLR